MHCRRVTEARRAAETRPPPLYMASLPWLYKLQHPARIEQAPAADNDDTSSSFTADCARAAVGGEMECVRCRFADDDENKKSPPRYGIATTETVMVAS